MKGKTISLIIFGVFIFIILFFFISQNFDNSDVKIELSFSQVNNINETELTLTVESRRDMSGVSGYIYLPENLVVVEGNLEWEVDLEKDEPVEISVIIKSTKDGIGIITAFTKNENTNVSLGVISKSGKVTKTSFSRSHEEIVKDLEERMQDPYWINNYYRACFDADGCRVPEPLKGEELNNYFRSLNLTDNPVYVLMQFDVLGADPHPEHLEILRDNGVELIDVGGGGHTYFAKASRDFLENKHYDFVRWIGVRVAKAKLFPALREKVWGQNCTGKMDLGVSFYENLNTEQFKEIKKNTNGCLIGAGYREDCNLISNDDFITLRMDIDKIEILASLIFVEKIIFGETMPSLLGGPGIFLSPEIDPFENIICDT